LLAALDCKLHEMVLKN